MMPAEIIGKYLGDFFFLLPGVLHAFSGWNLLILGLFIGHRLIQFRDPRFEQRVTRPTHTALNLLCTLFYGILVPLGYFLVWMRPDIMLQHRSHPMEQAWAAHLSLPWLLPPVLCVFWLLIRWIEAVLRGGAPLYGPNRLDRIISGIGFFLCLLFLSIHGPLSLVDLLDRFNWQVSPLYVFQEVMLRETYPLGTTLVFGFAFYEAIHAPAGPRARQYWAPAAGVNAALFLLAGLCGMMQALPATQRQALKQVARHRTQIIQFARQAQLDPALLAGIVYAGQRRYASRWFDRLKDVFLLQYALRARSDRWTMRPFGLAKMRPNSAGYAFYEASRLVWAQIGLNTDQPPYRPLRLSDLRRDNPLQPLIQRIDLASFHTRPDTFYDPDKNLAMAAVYLALLKRKLAEDGIALDGHPGLLASFYDQNPFRLAPRRNMKISAFGRRVLKFMKSDVCRRFFGDTGAPHEP